MSQKPPALTKLVGPNTETALPRPRLFRELDSALSQGQLVWIVAAPGSGKTTLASSYLRAKKRPTLWYTMDSGDADLATLFHFLSLASSTIGKAKRAPLPTLTPERRLGLEIFTRQFFEELGARLPPKSVIVFDNHQEIGEGREFSEVLSSGLAFLREGQKIIILSRREPPPALAMLEVGGRLSRFTDADLALTLEEARALARLRNKKGNDAPSMDLLLEKSRGWAAGVVMLLDQRGTTRTPDVVLDYLAQEYVDRLPAGSRDCLLRLALAPHVTSKMASALGVPQAMSMLSRLAKRGAFVTHREGALPSYEVHPILRELLILRLEAAETAESLAERRRIVADVSAIEGNDEVSISLYAANEDWDRLTDLVHARGPAMIAAGQNDVLERWLMHLPPEARESDPRAALWLGRCASGLNPPRACELFSRAWEGFARTNDLSSQIDAWTGAVLNIIATFDDPSALEPWIERFDKLVPPALLPEVTSSLAMVGLISSLSYRDLGHPRVAEWRAHSLSLLERETDPMAALSLAYGLTGACTYAGDFSRARRTCELAQRFRGLVGSHPAVDVFLCLTEALLAVQCGEGATSVRRVEDGIDAGRRAGIPVWNHLLMSIGAQGASQEGDVDAARTYLSVMAAGPAMGRLARAHHSHLSSYCSLVAGDLELAREQAESAVRLTATGPAAMPEALSRLALAEIHLAAGRASDAREVLAPMSPAHLAMSKLFDAQAHFAWIDAAERERGEGSRRAAAERAFGLARECGVGILGSSLTTSKAFVRRCGFALSHQIEVPTVCELLKAKAPADFIPPPWLERWSWQVRIELLGRLRIFLGGVELKSSAKPQVRVLELLQFLVVEGGVATEAAIADRLWPDADGDQAQQALSIAVHRLRALLGDATLLERRAGELSLDRRRVFADVWAIDALIEQAQSAEKERREELLAAARQLYVGSPAPVRQGHAPAWLTRLDEKLKKTLGRRVDDAASARA